MAMNQFTQVIEYFFMIGGAELVINSAADEDQRDNGNNDDNQDDVPVQRADIMIVQLCIFSHVRYAPLPNIRIL